MVKTICVKTDKIDFASLYPDHMDVYAEYCKADVENTKEIYKIMNGNGIQILKSKIKNVIFNDPATIVFWTDGTKTVVKCQDGDIFDPEKGLAMAISKKALGNKGNYCNEIKKWLPKEEKKTLEFNIKLPDVNEIAKSANALYKALKNKKKSYNPVQKAYDILVEARDSGNDGEYCLDDVIGYLGEALED